MNDCEIRVLLGSPVRQNTEILSNFLLSIRELDLNHLQVDYFFIDDNTEDKASQLLVRFAAEMPKTIILKVPDEGQYICNEDTHLWEEELIWKVAGFKNTIIDKALEGEYDYLFLVDSDLVLQPKTLTHLIGLKKDIVSEIFWTKWELDFPELPQVWVSDQYNLFAGSRGENLTRQEIIRRVQSFISKLKVPGVYPVGGLGACTLISKKALRGGVNYKEIYNISFIGEDRHFCIRAAALGFDLYVDTNYPAYHIYRLSDLRGLNEYKMRINQKVNL